jgi:hypothetical protein
MVLILSTCPFSKLFERNCRTSAIALEQVKHRLRLLSPQFRGAVDVGFFRRDGVPPSLSAARTLRIDLRNLVEVT